MDELPPLRRPGSRRSPDPLEQRLDRWVSTGRQLVDGVAGARPGSRPGARAAGRRAGQRPSLDGLGRWVEDRLDWLLEDDDWREPWQEPPPRRRPEGLQRRLAPEPPPPSPPAPPQPAFQPVSQPTSPSLRPLAASGPRRSLEAISRRGPERLPPATPDLPRGGGSEGPDDWPDDSSFQPSRWQRPVRSGPDPRAQPPSPEPTRAPGGGAARPLPRSSRRRA